MSNAPHHHDAENVGVLPGLPGSDTSPGVGPAVAELFAGLLEDAAAVQERGPREGAVAAHVARAGHGGPVGALVVPACGWERVAADLEGVRDAASGSARAVDVVVEADPDAADPLADAAEAATTLDGRDDVLVVALSVPLPGAGDAAAAADLAGRLALATPRADVRVWVRVAPGRGLAGVLQVLARAGDGVGACLPIGGAGTAAIPATEDLATALRACVDNEVPLRLTGGPARAVRGPDPTTGVAGHGVLNVVGAMRAALNGAEAPEVAEVLASTDATALASGTRRISEADAAVLRAFWVAAAVPDVGATLDDLVALGLLRSP